MFVSESSRDALAVVRVSLVQSAMSGTHTFALSSGTYTYKFVPGAETVDILVAKPGADAYTKTVTAAVAPLSRAPLLLGVAPLPARRAAARTRFARSVPLVVLCSRPRNLRASAS